MVSARFHETLVTGMIAVTQHVGEETVALTGGCFQNRRLSSRARRLLGDAGFRVLLHREVPPGDGGVSLGQVAVALEPGAQAAGVGFHPVAVVAGTLPGLDEGEQLGGREGRDFAVEGDATNERPRAGVEELWVAERR